MNSSFTSWGNDKPDQASAQDDKFDPSFARHPSGAEGAEGYPSVDDVTAAAVATAQRARKPLRRGGRGRDNSEEEEDDQVRAAQEAVAGLAQPEQYTHEEKLAAAVAQGAGRSPDSPLSDHEGSGSKLVRGSGTKRAIQNRNAQRAFRQRKEKYVKELELKAAEVDQLKQSIEELRAENLQLRDYTLALQSRVIELSPSNGQAIAQATSVQAGSDASANIMPTPPAVFNAKHGEK
ncbi:uncharacterized protein CANTADRAFT_8249 [Suhomyces tanzawaensis NRRL Y-17324]|uniref:BZIP domain-containing protein n=1 Tax=Suhomyces tanzawaensis NRRL Y-17324 TaxID=984487 RepID=A0A1E4SC45_9ASCO|nr:uncharacterized protein CANTADRAFT_8249 [Suhomyces tanzawaensis NRRL Y-17324]ODV77094.1 hypothetical protein CANTADRAFT_8249 [Suhomyces tanzawaensis NRRL Y-17324]